MAGSFSLTGQGANVAPSTQSIPSLRLQPSPFQTASESSTSPRANGNPLNHLLSPLHAMRCCTSPPLPLLFLLSLLTSTAFCTPSPVETLSAAPAHGGFHLPLQHRNTLSRRADPEGVRSWALREKGRLQGKYGSGDGARRERRQQTALSTAGTRAPTMTGTVTATATSSGNTTLPRNTVGLVQVSNFEADL